MLSAVRLWISALGRVHELRVSPAPPSDDELAQLGALDHGPVAPEGFSCGAPGVCCYPASRPTEYPELGRRSVDLRDDFDLWCRVGPRDDARFERPDLRPVCKLGPTFGYFRPRTWTTFSFTAAAAVSTGLLYGLAFGGLASTGSQSTTDRLEIGAHVMLASTTVLGTILTLVIIRDRRQARRFIEIESRRIDPL